MKRILGTLLATAVILFGFTGCEEILEAIGVDSGPGVVLTVAIEITNSDTVRVNVTNDGDEKATSVEFDLEFPRFSRHFLKPQRGSFASQIPLA
jgi:hypothetical protein